MTAREGVPVSRWLAGHGQVQGLVEAALAVPVGLQVRARGGRRKEVTFSVGCANDAATLSDACRRKRCPFCTCSSP